MMAPTDPMITTQRQPDSPSGAVGFNIQASSATSGTGMNPIDCWMAKVLPRARFGTSSEMIGIDGNQFDADADAGDQPPQVDPAGSGTGTP